MYPTVQPDSCRARPNGCTAKLSKISPELTNSTNDGKNSEKFKIMSPISKSQSCLTSKKATSEHFCPCCSLLDAVSGFGLILLNLAGLDDFFARRSAFSQPRPAGGRSPDEASGTAKWPAGRKEEPQTKAHSFPTRCDAPRQLPPSRWPPPWNQRGAAAAAPPARCAAGMCCMPISLPTPRRTMFGVTTYSFPYSTGTMSRRK